jgi:hypothetical protein
MTSMNTERVRLVDVVAFGCEIGTFVVLMAAVNRLIDGWRAWPIAVVLAGLVILAWARWIAPNADRRLVDPALFAAQAGLFLAVGALMALAGEFWVGFAFAAVATAAFALTRLEGAP